MTKEVSPSLKQDIAARLVLVRQHLSMTPTQLAKATGVEPQTVRDYENGKSVPGGMFLSRLVEHGIGIEWLLTGAGTITYHYVEALDSATRIRDLTKQLRDFEHNKSSISDGDSVEIDPSRLRESVILTERAAAVQPLTPEQRADMILSFYQHLSKPAQ